MPLLPATLLSAAVVIGGGGSPAPLTEAALEIAALFLLGIAVARGAQPLAMVRADPAWGVLLLAVILFPLVQLVPLPPAWWQALPGRGAAAAALGAAGEGGAWQPWSLLPGGGIAAGLALLPAVALAVMAAAQPAAARVRLVGLLAVLGVAAALLGLIQFMRGDARPLSFYAAVHRGWGIGFFANRNAQADLLAIALVAGVLLAERHREWLRAPLARAGVAAALLLILAGGVMTGSRMGLAMLTVPVVLAVVLAGRRAPVLAIGAGVAALLLLAGGTALDRVAARTHDAGNRTEIWGDALLVAREVAPLGGGMGSFVPLYTAAERLDHVQPTIANRAHNDWLELAIEGGLPALALAAAVLALVARRAAAGWRDPDPDRRLLARFAGLTAVILAAHSTVDYPLRTLTLLSVAGLALAGVASARSRPHKAGEARVGIIS